MSYFESKLRSSTIFYSTDKGQVATNSRKKKNKPKRKRHQKCADAKTCAKRKSETHMARRISMHEIAWCFPAKKLNAIILSRVHEVLHSHPGKIIETITAYFKQRNLLEHKQNAASILFRKRSGPLKSTNSLVKAKN